MAGVSIELVSIYSDLTVSNVFGGVSLQGIDVLGLVSVSNAQDVLIRGSFLSSFDVATVPGVVKVINTNF